MPFGRRGAAPSQVNGISLKKLTGTTAAAEGGTVTVAHGLTLSQIISWTLAVEVNASKCITQGNSATPGFEIQAFPGTTVFTVENDSANSELVLSKPFTILVFYTP